MGDTYRDPVDHARTTRPHAGRAVINVAGWPGYSLIIVGILAMFGSVDAFGTGHDPQGVEIGAASAVAAVLGIIWLAIEHRRIGRVTHHWHVAHPDVRRQPPSS